MFVIQIPTVVLYSNHLNVGLVWHLNGRFVSGSQMVRYLNGGLKTAKSCDFTIWIPDNHTVHYSDESGIQVFGIQMVTVQK